MCYNIIFRTDHSLKPESKLTAKSSLSDKLYQYNPKNLIYKAQAPLGSHIPQR